MHWHNVILKAYQITITTATISTINYMSHFSFSNSGQGGTASKRPKTTAEAGAIEETDSGKYIVHCY